MTPTRTLQRCGHSVLLVGVVSMFWTLPSAAEAGQPPMAEWSLNQPLEVHINSNFNVLFLNGQFVAAPYTIEVESGGVVVNGFPLQVPAGSDLDRHDAGERDVEIGLRNGRGRDFALNRASRRSVSPERAFARQLREQLDSVGILVAFDRYPPRFLPADGRGLSNVLLSENCLDADWDEILCQTESPAEATVWKDWLMEYQMPTAARNKLQGMVQNVLEFDAQSHASVAAIARLERYAYPLTVVGMLLGVIAFGHMLQWAGHGLHRQEATGESERYVILALGMMGGMALIDFVWTVLAGQAGQMKEVNPLAASFVESPAQLAIFKIVATGIGFSIMYFWRERHQIQQVAWWMCLVCVLLTFRWVMFDSMRA